MIWVLNNKNLFFISVYLRESLVNPFFYLGRGGSVVLPVNFLFFLAILVCGDRFKQQFFLCDLCVFAVNISGFTAPGNLWLYIFSFCLWA